MIFKRRVWAPPVDWERVYAWQRVQARKLADRLGRRAMRMPVGRLRLVVLLGLLGMFGLNGYMTFRSVKRYGVQQITLPISPRGGVLDSLKGTTRGKEMRDSSNENLYGTGK